MKANNLAQAVKTRLMQMRGVQVQEINPTLTRYWVAWYSSYLVADGCTKPPFQIWCTSQGDGKDSFCAVIDASSEEVVWAAIRRHFPDYVPRFCEARNADYIPGDRFPNFEGRTSIKEMTYD